MALRFSFLLTSCLSEEPTAHIQGQGEWVFLGRMIFLVMVRYV